MPTYIKKQLVLVHAFQLTRDAIMNLDNWPDWITDISVYHDPLAPLEMSPRWKVKLTATDRRSYEVNINDWVVSGKEEGITILSPEQFERLYTLKA